MSTINADPRLIAVDWGTTNARGYLLAPGPDGPRVIAESRGAGISRVRADDPDRDARFNEILAGLVRDWLRAHPGLPMIACGMIGAAQGWRTAPYRQLPTPLADSGGQVLVPTDLGELIVIPGVKKSQPHADVMRGEETQLAGLVGSLPSDRSITVVLPGTHTKWARVRDRTLFDFDTAMTGELFELLAEQSMVGRVAAEPAADQDWRTGFDWGLQLAGRTDRTLAFQAFVIRAAVLDEQLPPTQVRDALSGLLIGSEVAARVPQLDGEVLLCGGDALVARYARALAVHGIDGTPTDADTTVRGLWNCAVGAGLASAG